MQPYTKFQFIYPPRCETKIPYEIDSPVLKMWKGFPDAIAQYKLNGNRNVIYVSPSGDIEFWNRHQERQKYIIPDVMAAQIRKFSPLGHWTIWDTELLHTRTKHIKNTLYFYDCLVWESQYLIGQTYSERFSIVQKCLGDRFAPLDSNMFIDNIYIARNIPVSGWDLAAKETKIQEMMVGKDFCEGLVFKRTGNISRLAYGYQEVNNGGFMCKTRKPTKNSQF